MFIAFFVSINTKQYRDSLSGRWDNISMKKRLTLFIGSLVLVSLSVYLANYYLLIRINLRYFGIIFYGFVFILLIVNIIFMYLDTDTGKKTRINTLIGVGFFALMAFLLLFGGRTYFHAEEYSNLIEVAEEDFVQDIDTVDIDTLPLVDKAYGSKLGSLKLGEFPGIGSEFQAGAYSDIIYQGQQYLVAPLEYRGFFKWFNNRSEGTPGYILINKITAETQFINLKDTSGQGLLYVPSAYFNQDLERYAYYNGMSRYKLENQFFEIDESGHPYFVLQYSLPTVFINGGPKINKIAIVDAISGDVNIYSPGQEPEWVDSVYPDSLILQHLDYWGSLQDGWLNSVFAQRGVLQPSNGTRVIMNNGELYYFTGLTSAGNDESTIGFVYAGMKTKETRLFRFPGATEDAAMNKALTLLPQNNISTSFPIPINIEDNPTYFILIKGEDGRILRYVFISAENLEIFSMAETKIGAYNNYLVKLSETDSSTIEDVSGAITDKISYVSGGNTIYWIEIDNDKRYKINVSNFSDPEMSYFTSLDIGDTISLRVLDYNVVTIEID
jgi:heme/copper-type cytochrome/quinol oxidase subunit 4